MTGCQLAVEGAVVIGAQRRGKGLGRRAACLPAAQGVLGFPQGVALVPVAPLVDKALLGGGLFPGGLLGQRPYGQRRRQKQPCQQQAAPFLPNLFHHQNPFLPPRAAPREPVSSYNYPRIRRQCQSPRGKLFCRNMTWETKSSNFPPGVALCKITWYNVTNL